MQSLSRAATGLRRGAASPNLLLREVNRAYHRRLYRRSYNTAGVDVVAADWDNLLVLDACRYDDFADRHDLPGDLSARTSRGSHTSEFLRGNFNGRDLPDTVYVTASPVFQRGAGDRYRARFHDVVNVWREDGWDEEYGTVLPETTTRYARRAARDHPEKRLVVHYLQPHYPFVGSDLAAESGVPDPDASGTDFWGRLMAGDLRVPPAAVREAYRANLDRALVHVERLLAELPGKTVVTADHGNMFGEPARPVPVREWGHPPGVYTPELVRVPWLEHDTGTRKRIVAGEAAGGREAAVDEAVVEERLRNLGYRG